MSTTFDELERHVAAARRALSAPTRAQSAADTVRDVRKRVYLQVNQHYTETDKVAEILKLRAQPHLDEIVATCADEAYVKEIDAGVVALEAARRALPFLMAKACIELGVSAREMAALVEGYVYPA